MEITRAAADRLRSLRSDHLRDTGLRVFVTGQGCCSTRYGLAFDPSVAPDDWVTELRGIKLVVSAADMPVAGSVTIDFVDGHAGTGFLVSDPGSKGGCSCRDRRSR